MQKRAIQKTAEATGDLLIRKSLRRLQTSQEVYHRIVQRQLKVKQEI